jgi:hypothetical protein
MRIRCELVARHWKGELVDVGIGSGAFLDRWKFPKKYGYDINAAGCGWLRRRGLYLNPYVHAVDAVTLWDVLEHIEDPAPLLANVRSYVFLAVPIFNCVEHVLRSKHFRPDEHYWYFTRNGLDHVMGVHGFELVTCNMRETELGREDILSAVFRRA